MFEGPRNLGFMGAGAAFQTRMCDTRGGTASSEGACGAVAFLDHSSSAAVGAVSVALSQLGLLL